LRKKANSPPILSRAALAGVKAKQDFLENQLASLKAREDCVDSLREKVREAACFSADFERRFVEKKSQLVCARTCLNSLSSNASSLQLLALGRLDSAVKSTNRLSALLNELRSQSGGEGIKLGASAALDISRLARLPRLGTCDVPYLYREICKRFNSTPFVTPIEKVLQRIHQIIVDGDSIDLVNDELDASFGSMKVLQDVLRPSLEKMQMEEKEVCVTMAAALKKIALHCAKVCEKEKHLEEVWKHW
uniref:Vps54_N domain-containing protein n=1 Tax=Taenia asiatica TaxID=60517 RepID=A0A0R3W6L8_TAEAS